MDRLACLQAIANTSEEMLAATRGSQWELLQALETRQREYVTHLAPLSTSADRGTENRLIRAILDNHSAITALIQPLHQNTKTLLEAFSESAGTEK
ncbi:flagellar protein FliT [Ferribacterium limneticum]|nr:flagellar protein FliT [Ferribacterium limneticum]UCV31562.1 flagellar protein FliT [Ferribacterium limneticum]